MYSFQLFIFCFPGKWWTLSEEPLTSIPHDKKAIAYSWIPWHPCLPKITSDKYSFSLGIMVAYLQEDCIPILLRYRLNININSSIVQYPDLAKEKGKKLWTKKMCVLVFQLILLIYLDTNVHGIKMWTKWIKYSF